VTATVRCGSEASVVVDDRSVEDGFDAKRGAPTPSTAEAVRPQASQFPDPEIVTMMRSPTSGVW
jgi:hypothetical protein